MKGFFFRRELWFIMVEIQVRRSFDTDFRALLPATMFRTIEESRQGRNKMGSGCSQKASAVKGKQTKRQPNIIPAWKKDASFYRQYLEKDTPGNVPVNEVKDGLVQFRRKLQKFIRKEGQGIANASMKGLRSKFEEQLGYKMDKMMKLEFKMASLRAAESLLSSEKVARPEKQTRAKRRPNRSRRGRADLEQRRGKYFQRKKYRKGFLHQPIETVRDALHSDIEIIPITANTPRKSYFRRSILGLLPKIKFTANQINLHIANCVPDHLQIARAALGAITGNSSPSTSANTAATTVPQRVMPKNMDVPVKKKRNLSQNKEGNNPEKSDRSKET
ncbi:hypothetical protein BSL78_03043 [Apostichopus japonicus]|uniref:Uncharacterized protein n=1 Tax=Stichopus japonicus TaxID=307972 RepID=A0A2G8LII6_STIJA|nr:hypothetical protein BSL78_03043 [Apostichopus japonicus]